MSISLFAVSCKGNNNDNSQISAGDYSSETGSTSGGSSEETSSQGESSSASSSSSSQSSASSSSSVVSSSSSKSSASSSSSSQSSSSAQSSSTDSTGSMTMQQYIATIQSQIDQMSTAVEGSGMKMTVSASGNSLVYSYQYLIDIGDTSLVKDALQQALDTMDSTFNPILSLLKLSVPSASSIIVKYMDKDGNTICSKEFK